MSGIYGIYRYDGAPVDPQWLERMRKAMAYYGPHGGGCKIEESVGMGHLLLEVNPEDAFERQPMRSERGLVVTAARLDNRDALLDAFKIPTSEAPQVSDGRLVSLAFDRWGEEVCTHLEGDWALAAWDARERRLFLARDAVGNAGIYYYMGKGFFAFASSMKPLLALPDIVKQPDLLRLAEVLVCWQNDAELTAYKDFRRLIWAHAITVGADGAARIRRYWSPEGREPLRYRRDEEYVEAFLDLYGRAVRSCLRTQKVIAAELSGGRDSGSVVTMAAPILAAQGRDLTAFTSVPLFAPDGTDKWHVGNEWDLAHATASMAGGNVKHVAIDARDYTVLQGIENFIRLHDGPGHGAANHYWCQAIWEAASATRAGALLSGNMGNGTVSWWGTGSVLVALLRGHHKTAFRLLFQGESNPWFVLKRQILKPLLTPTRRFVRRLRTSGTVWQSYSALNIEMAAQLDLDGRMRAAGHDPTFTDLALRDYHSVFFSPRMGIGCSIASEVGAWNSFCCLDPTVNFSLVEFILRVPDDQFYLHGQSNFLIKRAFRNRMPEPVLYGKRKGMQGADVGHRILRELPAFQECLLTLDASPEARQVLDLPLLHRCLADLVREVNPETTENAAGILLSGIGAGLFLCDSVKSGPIHTC